MEQQENFFISEVSGETKASAATTTRTRYIGLDLLKILRENLSHTTFHSVGHIYNTHDYFLKLVLFICFLVSGSFCIYLTIKTFISFFAFAVLTTTSTVFDIPAECNLLKNGNNLTPPSILFLSV
jgi:hypothetical protein